MFEHPQKVKDLMARLQAFMDENVYPNEATFHHQLDAAADRWQPVPIVEELKKKVPDAFQGMTEVAPAVKPADLSLSATRKESNVMVAMARIYLKSLSTQNRS